MDRAACTALGHGYLGDDGFEWLCFFFLKSLGSKISKTRHRTEPPDFSNSLVSSSITFFPVAFSKKSFSTSSFNTCVNRLSPSITELRQKGSSVSMSVNSISFDRRMRSVSDIASSCIKADVWEVSSMAISRWKNRKDFKWTEMI